MSQLDNPGGIPDAQAEKSFMDRMRSSFVFFLGELWIDNGLEEEAPLEDVDFDIADWLQNGPRKRGILAWRGIGKTTLVVAYAIWRLFCNPKCRIKIISKSQTFAIDCVSMAKEWIHTVWFLKHLKPDIKARHRDKESRFDVNMSVRDKNPSMAAVGVDGQITGTRSHVLIADDVETLENTKTLEAREQLAKTTHEFNKISSFEDRFAEGGEIIIVGTIHHEDSLYDKLQERGYTFRSWPVILLPKKGLFARSKVPTLAPIISQRIEEYEKANGEIDPQDIIPAMPDRWGANKIIEALAEGPLDFAMQMCMISNLGEGFQYLSTTDLIVPDFDFRVGTAPVWIKWGRTNDAGRGTIREDIDVVSLGAQPLYRQIRYAEKEAPFQTVRMRVDPSGGGADETAYGIAGFLAGYVWALDVGGYGGKSGQPIWGDLHGSDSRVMQDLAKKARLYSVTEIKIESNFGQDMFAKLLVPELAKLWIEPGDSRFPQHPNGWRCQVISETAGTAQKERRIINALSPVMSQHRLIVHEQALRPTHGMKRPYELQYQLSAITTQQKCIPHDDRVEVLANVVEDFKEDMDIAPSHLEELIDEKRRQEVWDDRCKRNGLVPEGPKWAEIGVY